VVVEADVPAKAECAVDQGLVAADGDVGADLEVGPAQLVFDLFAALLDPVPDAVDRHDLGQAGGWVRAGRLARAGAEVISDFRVMADQQELFGQVASVPTAWRTLSEVAAAGEQARARVTAAVNAARRRAWAGIEARHGAIPGVAVADKVLDGVTCIRLDATVVTCHSPALGTR
jgi:hypothetical protein